jgi:hypothetical protein
MSYTKYSKIADGPAKLNRRAKGLAFDQITNKLYVSTYILPDYYRQEWFGKDEKRPALIETNIHSNDSRIDSNFVHHKNIKDAVKVHNNIVKSLKKKLNLI